MSEYALGRPISKILDPQVTTSDACCGRTPPQLAQLVKCGDAGTRCVQSLFPDREGRHWGGGTSCWAPPAPCRQHAALHDVTSAPPPAPSDSLQLAATPLHTVGHIVCCILMLRGFLVPSQIGLILLTCSWVMKGHAGRQAGRGHSQPSRLASSAMRPMNMIAPKNECTPHSLLSAIPALPPGHHAMHALRVAGAGPVTGHLCSSGCGKAMCMVPSRP